jgi:hypothetical protein
VGGTSGSLAYFNWFGLEFWRFVPEELVEAMHRGPTPPTLTARRDRTAVA